MRTQRRWGNWVIALVLAYLVVGGNRGLWNLYKLHQEKQGLEAQIAQLKSDIAHNQAQTREFAKNDERLEKRAREDLNLIKPGEIVYKFSKNPGR